jgi:hypothetical protein
MPKDETRWVTRHSPSGMPYQFLEPSLPRIPDKFLNCSVYLYPSEAAAEDGERIGGSGFVLGIPVNNGAQQILTVVTNKHVIEGGSMVARLNTKEGKKEIIALDQARWFNHPKGDDLTLCPVGLDPERLNITTIVPLNFLSVEMIAALDISPGDEVFVVGRFISREGRQRNMPSLRFGNIAQMPGDPIIDPKTGFEQQAFLVEAKSIAGYSGSPVFVQIPPPALTGIRPDMIDKMPGYHPIRSKIPVQLGPWLLGVDFCNIYSKDKVYSSDTGRPISDDWFVRANTGMMGVIPAWKILDILEGPEMAPFIKATDDHARENLKKKADQVSLDASVQEVDRPANDANPNHQEDFMRLVGAAARKPEPKD